MHPLIRILCFLVFTAWLAWGGPPRLLAGGLLLVPLYLWLSADLRPAWALLRRLRWFFLSLIILYGWFTPGQPLLLERGTALASLAPTLEGLSAGLFRCAVLVVIVLAVNLLLRTTARDQLLGAIHGLVRPLALVGLSRDRLALRMVLVIEAVDTVRQIVSERLAQHRRERPGLRGIGEFASDVVARVIDEAGRQPLTPRALALDGPPVLRQWGWPLSLCLLFWLAGHV